MTDLVIDGIDHVQLAAPAGCEEAARAFFACLLGLEELAKPPLLEQRGGCWFRVGVQELHVGVAAPFTPARKAHPAFRLSSVAGLHLVAERLAAGGAEVAWADREETPGVLRFFVDDPWGNRLEFLARSLPAMPSPTPAA